VSGGLTNIEKGDSEFKTSVKKFPEEEKNMT